MADDHPPQLLHADWPGLPDAVHAVTTLRSGGVSSGPYGELNLATHVGDDAINVAINRSRLRQHLALPSEPVWLNQVHGDSVIRVYDPCSSAPATADASVASVPGVVCAVLTADCLPVFFCSNSGDEVAIAHAGWRGLHAGIIRATLAAMNAPAEEVMVYLGPAIGPQAFEVGEEVYRAFVNLDNANAAAFVGTELRDDGQHYLCDIYQLARNECTRLGIGADAGGGACTFSDAERYYSYRREAKTGRMASLIWMLPADIKV